MTVCLAALCDRRRTLVFGADTNISSSTVEAELKVHKVIRIHRDWYLLWAAEDIAPVFYIADDVKHEMAEHSGPLTVDVVMEKVTRQYLWKRTGKAEKERLWPRGWTLERFIKEGAKQLPESMFREWHDNLRETRLGVDLIVAGFDHSGVGHIFDIDDEMIARRHDVPGFRAIGTGGANAEANMFYREYHTALPLEHALFFVFESKVDAEGAPSVGRTTDLWVFRQGSQPVHFKKGSQISLGRIWRGLKPRDLGYHDLRLIEGLKEMAKVTKASKSKRPKKHA